MEFVQFGWNAVTIGLLGTVIFTILSAWGLWQQKKAIWDNELGQSVSVINFSYGTAFFTAVLIYGISIKSIALSFNGLLLSFFNLPIILGLWKFKGFTKIEKFLGVCFLIIIIAMLILPLKSWFFLFLSFGNLVPGSMQALEIYNEKDAGVVEIKLLAVYLLSTLFWIIYAFAIDNWILQIISPLFFIILTITIVLWFKYKK